MSHNAAERYYDRVNTVCAVTSFATLVALGASATSFDLTSGRGRVGAICLSVVAALAAAIQAIRGYSGLAEAHRSAARRYAALSRQIERVTLQSASVDVQSELDGLQHRWDEIAEAAPNVPPRIRHKAKRRGFPRHFV